MASDETSVCAFLRALTAALEALAVACFGPDRRSEFLFSSLILLLGVSFSLE